MPEINDTEEIPEGDFSIDLKFIQRNQRAEPSLMAKYKNGMYHKGYICGGSNDDITLIICEDKIVIPSKIQSYVLNWYHTYLLHPGMYITEVIICQHLYWPEIRYAVHKEIETSLLIYQIHQR